MVLLLNSREAFQLCTQVLEKPFVFFVIFGAPAASLYWKCVGGCAGCEESKLNEDSERVAKGMTPIEKHTKSEVSEKS